MKIFSDFELFLLEKTYLLLYNKYKKVRNFHGSKFQSVLC